MARTARIEQAVEAINRGDEAYFDLYTDDVTIHGLPGTDGAVDKQGMIDFYRSFWSAFPDAKVEPIDVIGADDMVAVRLRVKGTHRGDLMGVAPSGSQVDVEPPHSSPAIAGGSPTGCWRVVGSAGGSSLSFTSMTSADFTQISACTTDRGELSGRP